MCAYINVCVYTYIYEYIHIYKYMYVHFFSVYMHVPLLWEEGAVYIHTHVRRSNYSLHAWQNLLIRMLQHCATLCNTLQHAGTQCNTLQQTATHCNVITCRMHDTTRSYVCTDSFTYVTKLITHRNTLQRTAIHYNTRQHIQLSPPRTHIFGQCAAITHTGQRGQSHTHCNTLQHTATHCNTLQHTATHCNTLQHTALWIWHTTHCPDNCMRNLSYNCMGSFSDAHAWHDPFILVRSLIHMWTQTHSNVWCDAFTYKTWITYTSHTHMHLCSGQSKRTRR